MNAKQKRYKINLRRKKKPSEPHKRWESRKAGLPGTLHKHRGLLLDQSSMYSKTNWCLMQLTSLSSSLGKSEKIFTNYINQFRKLEHQGNLLWLLHKKIQRFTGFQGKSMSCRQLRHSSNSLSYNRSKNVGKPKHLDQGKKEILKELHNSVQVSKQRNTGAKRRSKNSV